MFRSLLRFGSVATLGASLAVVALASPPPPASAPSFRFITLDTPVHSTPGHGAIDLGALRAEAPRGRAPTLTVRKRVGVRLEGAGAIARVSVSLAAEAQDAAVRVDGRRLSTIPLLIDAAHRVGATVPHEIELTIPAHVPPGPFLAGIVWHAETL